MSDVDDELLALVGGESSSSRASSPEDGSRRKRRRSPLTSSNMTNGHGASSASRRRHNRHDEDDGDSDADEDDEESQANPFPLEGIYKDDEDRERLLDMPELEREDELARRRDLISQRRQKAELAAMVRNQQMAGQRSVKRSQPAAKKQRRLKKASSSKVRRKHGEGDEDDGDDFAESEEEDDDDGEEEEEESDFEVSRRKGSRANQRAQLDKLKKKRAKARAGADSSEESSAESSGYSEGEMEELTRRKDARVRQMKGGRSMSKREDTKPSREDERLRSGAKKEWPTLEQVNAGRVQRDHLTRLVHRPEWTEHLPGRFARVVMNLAPHASARPVTGSRMILIGSGHAGDRYYELGDQYTNMVYTMYYGEAKYANMPLSSISNAPITMEEYERWRGHVVAAGEKVRRSVPSRELTLDRTEEFETYMNRPITEKDINEMIAAKRQARAAYEEYRSKRQQQQRPTSQMQPVPRSQQSVAASGTNGANGTPRTGPADEHTLAEMNERHRRADRERIADAERRSQQLRRQATQQHSRPASQPGSQPVTAPGSPRAKATEKSNGEGAAAIKAAHSLHSDPITAAALDIDIDLGDF